MWEYEDFTVSIHLGDPTLDVEFWLEVSEATPQFIESLLSSTTEYLDVGFVLYQAIDYLDVSFNTTVTDISEDVEFYLLFDDNYTEYNFEFYVYDIEDWEFIFSQAEYTDVSFILITPQDSFEDILFSSYQAEYVNIEFLTSVPNNEEFSFVFHVHDWIDISFLPALAEYVDIDVLLYVPDHEDWEFIYYQAEYTEFSIVIQNNTDNIFIELHPALAEYDDLEFLLYNAQISFIEINFDIRVLEQSPTLEESFLDTTTSYEEVLFQVTISAANYLDTHFYTEVTDISMDVFFYLVADDYYVEVTFDVGVAKEEVLVHVFSAVLAEYTDIDFEVIVPQISYKDITLDVNMSEYDDVEFIFNLSELEINDVDFVFYVPDYINIPFIFESAEYTNVEFILYIPDILDVNFEIYLAAYNEFNFYINITDIALDIFFIVKVSDSTPILSTVSQLRDWFHWEDRYFRVVAPFDGWYDIYMQPYLAEYEDISFVQKNDHGDLLREFNAALAEYEDIQLSPALAEYEDIQLSPALAEYLDFEFEFTSAQPYLEFFVQAHLAEYTDIEYLIKISDYLEITIEVHLAEYTDVLVRLKNDSADELVDIWIYLGEYVEFNFLTITADTIYEEVSFWTLVSDFPTREDIINAAEQELGGLIGDEEAPDLDDEDMNQAMEGAESDICEMYQAIYGNVLSCEDWEDLDNGDCRIWLKLDDGILGTQKYEKCLCVEISERCGILEQEAITSEELIHSWDEFYLSDQCTSACDKYYYELLLRYEASGGQFIKIGNVWEQVGGDQTIFDEWYTSTCVTECDRLYSEALAEYELTGDESAWERYDAIIDQCEPGGGSPGGDGGAGGAAGGAGGGGGGAGGGGGGGGEKDKENGDANTGNMGYNGLTPRKRERRTMDIGIISPMSQMGNLGFTGAEMALYGSGISPQSVSHPTFGTTEWLKLWGRKRCIRHALSILINLWIDQFSMSKVGKSLPIGEVVKNLMKLVDVYDEAWRIEYEAIKQGLDDANIPISKRVTGMWQISPYTGKLLFACDGNCNSCSNTCK